MTKDKFFTKCKDKYQTKNIVATNAKKEKLQRPIKTARINNIFKPILDDISYNLML